DGVEAAQVEDQTRCRRPPREAMAASAGYDVRAAVPREGKRARHVPGGGASDHGDRAHVVKSGQRWTAPGLVRRRIRSEQLSAEGSPQGPDLVQPADARSTRASPA